ncbi:MAG: ClpXP protease specificity-enhancing factor SspB [Acidobacteria bacterium]|nr:ClpXP protease specificity-enhancing factor SspB [Acidobacteriota bacterium]
MDHVPEPVFLPTRPDFADVPWRRQFRIGTYVLVLAENPPPYSARFDSKPLRIEYPVAMALIETELREFHLFVTLEKSRRQYFLCTFTPDEQHQNFGKADEDMDEEMFVAKAIPIILKALSLPEDTEVLEETPGSMDNLSAGDAPAPAIPETAAPPAVETLEQAYGIFRDELFNVATAAWEGAPHEAVEITFLPNVEGVHIPDELAERFSDGMTIIIEHEFQDLSVGGGFFSVTLWFDGKPEFLQISFAAIRYFGIEAKGLNLEFS